jgi:hypothetical protein
MRETTVSEPANARPQTSASLTSLLSKSLQERGGLVDLARMETTRTIESLPIASQNIFAASWSDRVKETCNSTLKQTLEREIPSYSPHVLVDETDVLKYSGTTAVIIRSQSNDEMKFRLSKNYRSFAHYINHIYPRSYFHSLTHS